VKRRSTLLVFGLLLGSAAQGQVLELEAPSTVVDTEAEPEGELDPGEAFVNANTAYEAGDYLLAIDLLTRLADHGFDSGHLHFNLGNAYLRNGELGHAVASYRRAAIRLPRDEDVQANLAFARQSTKDALSPTEPSAVLSTLFFWHYGLSLKELQVVVLSLNLLFWGVWAIRLFHQDSEVLRWIFILLLVLLVATAGSLFVHQFFPLQVAVVVPQEIEARTAPDPESVVRFKLHAGTEVKVKDRRPGWLRIVLPDGQQGWVEEQWTELVEG
jgi:SH3-like domain-containing protein